MLFWLGFVWMRGMTAADASVIQHKHMNNDTLTYFYPFQEEVSFRRLIPSLIEAFSSSIYTRLWLTTL